MNRLFNATSVIVVVEESIWLFHQELAEWLIVA
jgi:hypothetical protein